MVLVGRWVVNDVGVWFVLILVFLGLDWVVLVIIFFFGVGLGVGVVFILFVNFCLRVLVEMLLIVLEMFLMLYLCFLSRDNSCLLFMLIFLVSLWMWMFI